MHKLVMGVMTQRLRALDALSEYKSWVLRTHMVAHNYQLQEDPTLSSGLLRYQIPSWCTNIHAGKTLAYIK